MMEMILTPRRQNRSGVDILREKKFHMPTAYTILFLLLILVAAATWIVPAGSYDYADGVPIAGTYHAVEQNPQGPRRRAAGRLLRLLRRGGRGACSS